jgi:3',5'-cyclic AMP phosphodiesterase CpdA
MGHLIVLFASLPFGSSRNVEPAAILLSTWWILVAYRMFPAETSFRIYKILVLYISVTIPFSLFHPDKTTDSIGLSILFSIGMVLIVLLESIRISYINFQRLIEVIPVEPSAKTSAKPLFSFVTDIHITESDSTSRAEGGCGGQLKFVEWLQREGKNPPDYLLIGGDQTDTGSISEWKRFCHIANHNRNEHSCLLFAPGNHDMCSAYQDGYVSFLGTWAADPRDKLVTYFRALAPYVPTMKTAMGDTLKGLANTTPDSFQTVIQEVRDRGFEFALANVDASPDLQEWNREDARLRWFHHWFDCNRQNFFPLQLEDTANELLILVLNSCPDDAFSRRVAPSALGRSARGSLGQGQLGRLAQTLSSLPKWCKNVLILMHHPPYRRPGEWKWKLSAKGIRDSAFLTFDTVEARELLTLLVERAHERAEVTFVLCCGHRHTPVAAYVGRVLVLEGASMAESNAPAWRGSMDDYKIRVARA